jgi:hypothetical protein
VSTDQVLHIDFIALAPDAAIETREELISSAGALATLANVERVGAIEAEGAADFDLAFFFVLRGFASLEPFGTDPAYSSFLQTRVAPLLRGLAGADVRLESDFPSGGTHAVCLALAAPATTYDWEVSNLLRGWLDQNRLAGTTGLAIGEHGRFRGVAVAFADAAIDAGPPSQRPFGPSLIAGRVRALP